MNGATGHESLRELGKQVPWEQPDPARAADVRAALLAQVESAGERERAPSRRWLVVGGGFAAGALAAAAVMFMLLSPAPNAAPAHARIDAPADAELDHTVTATPDGTDEVVRVRAGTVRLTVPQMRGRDRVRTRTGDAEIEGSGAYDVVVVADTLSSVRVRAGTATVRLKTTGQPRQIVLAAGETWRAKVETATLYEAPSAADGSASAAEESASAAAPSGSQVAAAASPNEELLPTREDDRATRATSSTRPMSATSSTRPTSMSDRAATRPTSATSATSPTPMSDRAATRAPSSTSMSDRAATRPRSATSTDMPAVNGLSLGEPPAIASTTKPAASPTERHFQRGWQLLRAGKAREAIAELAAAADADPKAPLAADARYFQAIALARVGQAGEAERVLADFLERAPTSLRRGRASLLLGRLLRDRGDEAGARRRFEFALRDGDPDVAAAARSHLDALE